jgi:hypothetical protein
MILNKLTTCFNVSPSPVELSNEEPETITANLCNERRRLKIILFFAIVLARRACACCLLRPTADKSFSLLICSFCIGFNVFKELFVVVVVDEIRIEFRIFD